VISDVWTWSVAELAAQLFDLSAGNRASAIHALLHHNYDAEPVLHVPAAGADYELRAKR
jgi:hypothetical protein